MIGKQTNKSLIYIVGNANWTNVLKSERMIFFTLFLKSLNEAWSQMRYKHWDDV